jgi:hypothetical protein
VPATAAAPAKFKGKTAQNRTVTFTLKGSTVSNFSAGINMMCVQAGIEFNAVIPPKPLKVSGGKFAYSGRDVTDGTNITINGTVKGRSASGTVKMTDSRYNASDESFDSCTSVTAGPAALVAEVLLAASVPEAR